MKEEVSEEELKGETDALTALFRKALNNDKLEVKVEKLKNEKVSSMITLSEENRRMQEMMKMYNMYGMDPSMFGTDDDSGSECQQCSGEISVPESGG